MEDNSILDPSSETDLFVLHCVFLPWINHQLSTFQTAWNLHPIRTEHNWSPRQIWLNGVLDPQRANQTGIRDIVDGLPAGSLDTFGLDYYGPLTDDALEDDTNNTVYVPHTEVLLSDTDLQEFVRRISDLPIQNYGIDTFVQARDILRRML